MLSAPIYIETYPDLLALVNILTHQSLIAIDTESNNLYTYQERVCLIQISTRDEDYIIDPLVLDDLSALYSIMGADYIEKVFHGAEYDVASLKRDFGFRFNYLFDTMTAARLCGFEAVGLSSVLYKLTGLRLDKSHQMDNWGVRPLSSKHLHYAQMDTLFLPYMRDEFHKHLKQRGQIEEAFEIFAEIAALPPAPERNFRPDDFWKVGRPFGLRRHEMKVLCELYAWREETARGRDLPPNKVLSNRALIEISRRKPNSLKELGAIRIVSRGQYEALSGDIIEAIQRGKRLKTLPPPPKNKYPSPEVSSRYAALRLWRQERASERGVDSDIIISRKTLWTLAYAAPDSMNALQDIEGIGPWRLANYGEELLNILQQGV